MAHKYANLNKIKHCSLLFSGPMMLEDLDWFEVAELIHETSQKTTNQKIATYDFAGQMQDAQKVGTSGLASAIIKDTDW
jgi:isocitrate dehydrogenase